MKIAVRGLLNLVSWMKALQRQHAKTDVIFGIEPTGQYWFTLAEFIQDQTYETAWKATKAVLSYQGVELRHPREIFSEAFSSGWIKEPDTWDAMIEDRNLTTHTYKERTAESVYEAISKSYYPALRYLHQSLNEVIHKHVDLTGNN